MLGENKILLFMYVYITYSYILSVVAVTQVEMANEIAAIVLWVTVGQSHTHRTNLQ